MKIITRKEAIAQGLKRYFTGKPCKYGHFSDRLVIARGCLECKSMAQMKYYKDNYEKISEKIKKYQEANKSKISEYKKKYNHDRRYIISKQKKECYQKTIDSRLSRSKKYYLNNKDKVSERQKKHRAEKPHVYSAKAAKRHAAKLNRTPKWLTEEHEKQIRYFYKQAKRLENLTGIVFHVDHIVPLQGVNVGGLHVPWNLQLLTAYENISKGNRHE